MVFYIDRYNVVGGAVDPSFRLISMLDHDIIGNCTDSMDWIAHRLHLSYMARISCLLIWGMYINNINLHIFCVSCQH